ncbi:ATP-binding protein [[Mycobacterium] nativiensis]|uniref:Adenylate/guanylate cyclase domain-containing protein n=1 Tax=[Mycobacterium] nativiensis TaxID=2855503 RepID=A0ABU5XUA6_9MYCO|nr:adenylate/guanylate cyclase domain-containing protein [Mycolicibacter sp. MYC340]MEB3031510.1 adenylate/guanylate cyclase domain-containing protein [Mycolicibacter sp. MYC340]
MTVAICQACGTEPLENARFCHSCGSPITAASRPAEYKQATVLFADVVHSMDIAEAVGAERLREIMTELFNRCAVIVRRYGGTVDKFTGDGVMAVFGAPVSLEDHAFRACLAALEIQRESTAATGGGLQLRVGLNSGEVVAGEIGAGPGSYTTIGAQVGLAQRMESVAPPGGVMLSEATARLVEGRVELAAPELVSVKGFPDSIRVCRLLRAESHHELLGRAESSLVGRHWELAAVTAILERAIDGHGGVIGVVGPPGIGKSRLVREISGVATQRGVPVYASSCESHASDIPFHVVEALLRTATGVADLDPGVARARVRARVPDADAQDLLLFDDLIGIADPALELPRIDPDARRRRLTALVNAATLARTTPEVYVIEDAHWIDEVSESMLADFMAVIPQTRSLVVITYRPEYHGGLTRIAGAHTITLAPLSDSESSALIAELLGTDPSVAVLSGQVVDRAAGNPFFAQEMVRDLAERGVLHGKRGEYLLAGATDQVSVPATLQATIAARIDRLEPAAKRTLRAAAVIGSRFSNELLMDLDVEPAFSELLAAELIDQVRFTPYDEYAFHHPLVRAVAYESQLKADRAELHRRLATAIETHDPTAADANAALIGEHLEAAGDLWAAYSWHMRAGSWSANRNIAAAQVSWERARQIADALPESDPARLAMRIAPRTLICAHGFRANVTIAGERFDELQELCAAAGDKGSLAVAMTGLIAEHMFHGRVSAASRLASEQKARIEAIGDPTLTVGLSFGLSGTKIGTGEAGEVLQWSQHVIDLADGDPRKGNFIVGSPLALALAARGFARSTLGRTGWREDFSRVAAMASSADPLSYAICVAWTYGIAIAAGVLLPDRQVVQTIEEAVRIAERSADDISVGFALYALAVAMLHQDPPADERGVELFGRIRDMCVQGRFYSSEIASIDAWIAMARARQGDLDTAVDLARNALDQHYGSGQLGYCVFGSRTLVEMLLDRGRDDDLKEAQETIERLAAAPLSADYVSRDLTLLRLRALLARARGDDAGYRDFAARYRAMAIHLDFEGHMALAEEMN